MSRDFADRIDDEPILTAVEGLNLPALSPPAGWNPPGIVPRPSQRAFKPSSFIPYFRAIRFNTLALSERMVDERDRAEVVAQQRMAESFLSALNPC